MPQTTGVALIIWHKDNQLNEPIYALDARGSATLRDAKQQVIADWLKGRARLELLEVNTRPLPALIIDEARLEDAGLYTCTVEFNKAPTQTYVTRALVSGEFFFV